MNSLNVCDKIEKMLAQKRLDRKRHDQLISRNRIDEIEKRHNKFIEQKKRNLAIKMDSLHKHVDEHERKLIEDLNGNRNMLFFLPTCINTIVLSYIQLENKQYINIEQLVYFFLNYLPRDFFGQNEDDIKQIKLMPCIKLRRCFNLRLQSLVCCNIGKASTLLYFKNAEKCNGFIMTSTCLYQVPDGTLTFCLDDKQLFDDELIYRCSDTDLLRIRDGWKKRL
jgi:hypothetical protein